MSLRAVKQTTNLAIAHLLSHAGHLCRPTLRGRRAGDTAPAYSHSLLKYYVIAAIMFLSVCAAWAGDEADPVIRRGNTPTMPTVSQLLDEVLAQFPPEQLLIEGRLWKGKYPRSPETNLKMAALVQLGGKTVTAAYAIRDFNDKVLEQLKVVRTRGQKPLIEYAAGDPLVTKPLPDLNQAVQDLDITWLDLTLSFLWWRDGTMIGTDSCRGRDCFVVNVRPSPGDDAGVGTVKMWIDQEARVLLQAEQKSADGQKRRRLMVKSFKKIDEKWMVKDIEILNLDDRTKTTLRVDSVKDPAGKNLQDAEVLEE